MKIKSHWISVLLSFDLSWVFFFKSSQVLDSIMGLEYFFCFLKGRNRQMHDKRSVIAWTHSLQVLNSCSNTVDCVLSYCSNLFYLQELASAGRLYCLLRLYNCYCGLCIKSLLLSFLMGPGNSDLLLTQSSLVYTVPPPDNWGQLCGSHQKACLSSRGWPSLQCCSAC